MVAINFWFYVYYNEKIISKTRIFSVPILSWFSIIHHYISLYNQSLFLLFSFTLLNRNSSKHSLNKLPSSIPPLPHAPHLQIVIIPINQNQKPRNRMPLPHQVTRRMSPQETLPQRHLKSLKTIHLPPPSTPPPLRLHPPQNPHPLNQSSHQTPRTQSLQKVYLQWLPC